MFSALPACCVGPAGEQHPWPGCPFFMPMQLYRPAVHPPTCLDQLPPCGRQHTLLHVAHDPGVLCQLLHGGALAHLLGQ